MTRLIVVFLAAGLHACAARQAVPIAAGADLVTTELVIAQGGYERNPFPGLQTTGGRFALKAAVTVLVVWACERFEAQGHGWASAVLKWTAIGVWGAAATWNAYLARSQ